MAEELDIFSSLCGSLNAMDKLIAALESCEEDVTKLSVLLDEVLDINARWTNGCTPLTQAVITNNTLAVKLLLERGADVNVYSRVHLSSEIGKQTESPIISASRYGHLEVTRVLLTANCDLGLTVGGGKSTALHYACNRGYLDIAQALVENGADINSLGDSDFTPILEATMENHIDIVRELAKRGALLDGRAKSSSELSHSDTSLMVAVKCNFQDIADYLVQAGCNVNDENEHGTTAIAMSITRKYDNMIPLFLLAGGKLEHRHLAAPYIDRDFCRRYMTKQNGFLMSLCQLCRITIRQRLMQKVHGCSILGLIEELPIPKQLKDFVSLKVV